MALFYGLGLANYFNRNSDWSSRNYFSNLLLGTNFTNASAKNGKSLATMDTLNKATEPKQKIYYAGQVANTIKLSSDAATLYSNPARVKDITNQTKQVVTAPNDAVSQLKSAGGIVKAGQADPNVKSSQASIASALDTVHKILSQVGVLLKKTSGDIASQVKLTMKDIDTTACDIATLVGVSWKSLFKGGTSIAGTTAQSSSYNIIDYFA